MIDLLDTNNNAIKNATTTQMVTADMLLSQAKKEATAAAAAAKKVAKSLGKDEVEVKTAVMTREEAKHEADKQNIANQTIVGTKVGLVEVMKRLIRGDILDNGDQDP